MTNLELINRLEKLEDTAVPEARVITCNDMVVCVVIGSEEEARARLEVERVAYFDRSPWNWVVSYPSNWNELTPAEKRVTQYEAYKAWCHWLVRDVPLY